MDNGSDNRIGIIKQEGPNLALYDPSGPPLKSLFLGKAKSVGVSIFDANAKSGNPAHDVHSGKFSSTGGKDKKQKVPANSDPDQYQRLRDTVIDAARESGIDTPEQLASFLKGRTQRPPTEAELSSMLAQIQQIRIDHLVDLIHGELTGKKSKRVTLSAPKVWVRKAFETATDQDIAQIVSRLEAKGHKRSSVVTKTVNKVYDKGRRASLKADLS